MWAHSYLIKNNQFQRESSKMTKVPINANKIGQYWFQIVGDIDSVSI